MTGMELDKCMREILTNATRKNVFESAAKLINLGFGGVASFLLVLEAVEAQEKRP